ncbi:jg889 [Pararge aegeria aegeria]|uniref:Jg889 protein n=1 Tax=Pararge aegeria aegeria TaxID=348720 RepID=A0A8S4SA32_9NEOP|nr:jg889 [Pararge aegeria aegeria]
MKQNVLATKAATLRAPGTSPGRGAGREGAPSAVILRAPWRSRDRSPEQRLRTNKFQVNDRLCPASGRARLRLRYDHTRWYENDNRSERVIER